MMQAPIAPAADVDIDVIAPVDPDASEAEAPMTETPSEARMESQTPPAAEPVEFDPATAPALPEVRRPCAMPNCHRPAQRMGKLFGVQTRPATGWWCWTHAIEMSADEEATRTLLEVERARLPELRAAVIAAARAHIQTLSRDDERKRNAAQKALAEAETGVGALELELADTLARDAAAKSEDAKEIRAGRREALIALLERLKGKFAEIAILITSLLTLWRETRELAGEIRQYFEPRDLDHNGFALGNALSAGSLSRLIETEPYRQGAAARMPGADAAALPMDYRQRPEALPELSVEMARIAALALARFDHVAPVPARPDPPRDPKTYGSAPPGAFTLLPKKAADPPSTRPVQPAPAPLALTEAEREAGYQRALAEVRMRANAA